MRGVTWTGDEVAVLRANLGLTDREIREAFLPRRSLASIGNQRSRISRDGPEYAVKSPGRYVETLADMLVDAWDCMEIWCRWNGYATWRELGRDERGWVTVLCTAKE